MRTKFTKAEKSWIMYDVGNSALVLLATSVIPIYFKSLADGPALVAWSYAETVASLVIALLMPILGSIADMQGMKKKFIVGTVGTGVVATVAMGFPTSAMAFLVIYVVSSIMLNSSMVFYDALLIDATTDDRMDEVSSQGYAWGYVGSCVAVHRVPRRRAQHQSLGISLQTAMQISFAITAAWWVAFTIPMLRNVQQTHYKPLQAHALRNATRGIGTTLRKIWADRGHRAYIPSRTSSSTACTPSSAQHRAMAPTWESTARSSCSPFSDAVRRLPSAIAYGKLDQVGTKKMLLTWASPGYTFITLFAAFFLRTAREFWILALLVGLFQGGLQALSRSEFGKLCPKEHANEYFGFFDIFGKYAAIMGTFIVGTMTALTGNGSLGVLSIVVLFVIGFVLMLKTPDSRERAS